jgi:hypothetical protein
MSCKLYGAHPARRETAATPILNARLQMFGSRGLGCSEQALGQKRNDLCVSVQRADRLGRAERSRERCGFTAVWRRRNNCSSGATRTILLAARSA